MRKLKELLPTTARILLGIIFFVFGLNGFLHLFPVPTPPSGRAAQLIGAIHDSGYLYALLKLTEIAGGLLLLIGRFVPLALIVLAPIVVNIAGYHLFLAPTGTGAALLMVALEIYLAWCYRTFFIDVLKAGAKPGDPASSAAPAAV